jgi:hypothetical protein
VKLHEFVNAFASAGRRNVDEWRKIKKTDLDPVDVRQLRDMQQLRAAPGAVRP